MKNQLTYKDYHVALNTEENEFIVYDVTDASVYTKGITIEEAIKKFTSLKNSRQ